jgi:hypothetical protein
VFGKFSEIKQDERSKGVAKAVDIFSILTQRIILFADSHMYLQWSGRFCSFVMVFLLKKITCVRLTDLWIG